MFNPERVRLVTNPFRVQSFLFIYLPRVLAGSNPGLQLANAFGVEAMFLRCQIGISKFEPITNCDRFRKASGSSFGRMLSPNKALLCSQVCYEASGDNRHIEIMLAFVKLRQMLASNAELSRRLDELESKFDKQFRVVFVAIRQLMATPARARKEIGFHSRAAKK